MANGEFYNAIEAKLDHLKEALWTQWDQLIGGQDNDADWDHSRASKQILEYESLVECMIVGFNQSNGNFSLTWVKSQSHLHNDKLSLVRQYKGSEQPYETGKEELPVIYGTILGHINWIHGFRQELRSRLLSIQDNKLEMINKLRDDMIASHTQPASLSASANTKSYKIENTHTRARDQLLNKSQQLTNNLIKSNTLLQSSVLQSDLNLDDLKQQTHGLTQLQDKYSQLELVFDKTNNLVKTLQVASNQEKRDVYLSLGLLCLAISWVMWRRIFKGPTKLFLWILFKFFKGILITTGLVKKGISTTPNEQSIISPNAITSSVIATTTSSYITAIEQVVDEAMDRILFNHDEL